MNGNGAEPSALDKAIQATQPVEVKPASLAVTLSSGRQIALLVPADLTIREALDIVSFVSSGLGAELEKARQPAGGLVIATGPLPRSPA